MPTEGPLALPGAFSVGAGVSSPGPRVRSGRSSGPPDRFLTADRGPGGAGETQAPSVSGRRSPPEPQHPIPAPLKLVRHPLDSHLETPRPEFVDDALDVRRRRSPDPEQREDPHLHGHPQHLLQGADVEAQIELPAVEEEEVGGQREVEGTVVEGQRSGNDASR